MTATADAMQIPALCCSPGNHARDFDLNSSWTCKRAAAINSARGWADDIDRTQARIGRLRGNNVERRAANLRRWVADQTARMAQLGQWWNERECAGVGYAPVTYCGGYTL